MIAFIQFQATERGLYGLDRNGQLWFRLPPNAPPEGWRGEAPTWVRLEMPSDGPVTVNDLRFALGDERVVPLGQATMERLTEVFNLVVASARFEAARKAQK